MRSLSLKLFAFVLCFCALAARGKNLYAKCYVRKHGYLHFSENYLKRKLGRADLWWESSTEMRGTVKVELVGRAPQRKDIYRFSNSDYHGNDADYQGPNNHEVIEDRKIYGCEAEEFTSEVVNTVANLRLHGNTLRHLDWKVDAEMSLREMIGKGLLLTADDGEKRCCKIEKAESTDFHGFKLPPHTEPHWGECEFPGHGSIYLHQDKHRRIFGRANLVNVPAYPGKMRVDVYKRAEDDNGNTVCSKQRGSNFHTAAIVSIREKKVINDQDWRLHLNFQTIFHSLDRIERAGLMLTLEDGNSTMLNGNKLCCKIKKSHKVAGREAYKRVIRDVSNYAKCTFGEQVYYGNKKSPGRMWNIFMRETPYHDPELTYPVIKNFDNGYKKIVRTDVGVWLKDWIRGENLKLHQEPTSNEKTCWVGPGNRDPWWRPYHVVSPRLYPDRSGKIEEFELDTSFPLEELTKFNLMWGYSIRITFAKRHQVCCHMYKSNADEFENFRLPGLHTRTKSLKDFGEETSSSFY